MICDIDTDPQPIHQTSNVALGRQIVLRAFRVGASVLLSVSLLPTAAAQGLLTEDESRALEEHLTSGARAYKDKRYTDAIEHYGAAQELKDDPQILYAIARSYQQIHDCDGAAKRYEALLSREDTPEALAEKTRSRLSSVENTCVSKGKLSVVCSKGDATLKIAEQQYSCPLQTTLEVGRYTLSANTPDGWRGEGEVEIRAGKEVTLALELAPPQDIEVAANSSSDEGAQNTPSALRLGSYGAMALGSGLLVAGVLVDTRAAGRTEDLARAISSSDRQAIEELEQESAAARRRTMLLYGAGAGVLATGLVLRFVVPDRRGDATGNVSLRMDHGGAMLQTTWSW